jgi:uncharacterized membrane protein YbhN (UPF0104 family)
MGDRGVGASATATRLGLKLFAAPPNQPRARRATDAVLLVVALLGLVLAIAAYPPSTFEGALQRFLASVPSWLDPVWAFCADLLWLSALVLGIACLLRRRLAIVAQALLALVLAVALGLVAARLAAGSWPAVVDAVFRTADAPPFPDVRAALAATVLLTVSPHLVRPLRRASRWIVTLGVVGATLLGGVTPGGTLAALFLAVVAASAVRLALGTSVGRPGLGDVAAGLGQLGVTVRGLEEAERQDAGVFHLRGRDGEGRPLLVKVYGRDAYDTQLVATLWRRAWYRGSARPIGESRLQAAEHEAFVTLLARSGGIPTREVVTAATTIDDNALLVLRGEAAPLETLPERRLDDTLLRGVWRALARLAELRIAHQRIEPSTLALVGGEVGLVDLGGATVAPDAHQLATDRAQLLATTVLLAGRPRALRVAGDELGRGGLAELLPYLQSAALTSSLRRALKAAGVDADELREEVAAQAGVEAPEPFQVRRVTGRSALQLALLILASYTIISAASGVDWEEVRSTVSAASGWWLLAAFVAAQLPRVAQAFATLGSVPASLPLGPVYAMELAAGYMNVALPSYVARMAVTIRFFQRQGVSPPTAVSASAIDSVTGTLVQGALLALLLLFTESSLDLELPLPSGGTRVLLWLLVAAAVATALVLVLVGPVRRAVAERVRRWWPEVRAAVGALRRSSKLALLLLGNLAREVLFAVALGMFARAFGYDVSLAELLVINISVSLLASFIPVPGGVGVSEFGLTVGLTSAGLSPEAAVATVLCYRISTFYLPPLWGFFAMRWLQRNRYL